MWHEPVGAWRKRRRSNRQGSLRREKPVQRRASSFCYEAAVDFVADVVEVGVGEVVVVDHEHAADVDALDVRLGGDEDEVRVGVFEDAAEAGGIDDDEVGELAGFEGAEFVLDAEDVGRAHGVQPQDLVGAHHGGVLIFVVDGVEAGAHVLEGVGEVGAGFTIDAHADADAELQVFGNVGDAGGEAAVGERVPDHGGVGFGGLLEDELVGMDEVAEDELVVDEAGVEHPAEFAALLALVLGGFDEVGLVAEVEFVAERRLHHRLLLGVVEGGHAVDHHAEEGGVVGLRLGPVEECFEALAGGVDGGAGLHLIGLIAVDEAEAGFGFGAELGLVEGIALVLPGGASVVEVVGGGDAVLQVIVATVESEPIEVVGGIVEGVLAVEVVDPAGEGAAGGEAAVGGLPQVRVRGDEAGNDPGAVSVPGLRGVEVRGRVAGADLGDGAVVGDEDVPVDRCWRALLGR